MSNLDKKLFATPDISVSAFLCLRYPIKSINRENPKRILFMFEKDKNFDTYVEGYWSGKIKVQPLQFYQSLKMLKGRIYSND